MICLCVCLCFPPFVCFVCRLQHHKREERKQRYSATFPPSSLHYFWFLVFILLNQDLTLHYDFFFSPESEIRARLQSASPTAGRCKTAWIALIQLLCHEATKHLYLTVYFEKKDIFLLLLSSVFFESCCSGFSMSVRTWSISQVSCERLPPRNFN